MRQAGQNRVLVAVVVGGRFGRGLVGATIQEWGGRATVLYFGLSLWYSLSLHGQKLLLCEHSIQESPRLLSSQYSSTDLVASLHERRRKRVHAYVLVE